MYDISDVGVHSCFVFFFKQKTAYEMRISDWSSDVCSSDLTPYSRQWNATIGPQCPVNVSQITLSPHVGAHADAPLHYSKQGAAIGQLGLEPFLGPCRVIHVLNGRPLIAVDDLLDRKSTRLNSSP